MTNNYKDQALTVAAFIGLVILVLLVSGCASQPNPCNGLVPAIGPDAASLFEGIEHKVSTESAIYLCT